MSLIDWGQIEPEQLNALLSRQVVHTEHLTIARLHLARGAVVPMHHHVNEQVTMVQSGCLRFLLNGEEILVAAGQCLRIAPNEPHAIEVIEDCVVIDVFSPPREDWIRGDDAYLRR